MGQHVVGIPFRPFGIEPGSVGVDGVTLDKGRVGGLGLAEELGKEIDVAGIGIGVREEIQGGFVLTENPRNEQEQQRHEEHKERCE